LPRWICDAPAGHRPARRLPGQAERGIRDLRRAIGIEALAAISVAEAQDRCTIRYTLVTRDMKKPT
jgi:hypothetical protein